jgi:hypothetical protein
MYCFKSECNRVSRSFSKGDTKTALFVLPTNGTFLSLTPLSECLGSKELADNSTRMAHRKRMGQHNKQGWARVNVAHPQCHIVESSNLASIADLGSLVHGVSSAIQKDSGNMESHDGGMAADVDFEDDD